MHILRPVTGVLIFDNCWTSAQCADYLREVELTAGWEAAAMGRYQDDKVVESLIDKEMRDVEVLNLETVKASNPLTSISGLLDLVNAELECDAKRISRSMVSKYSVGSHIKAHKDTGIYTTSRIATLVFYLNDNFKGGELYFPDLSFQYSPRAGQLVCFYSELRHGVRPVEQGSRYCVVGFAENDIAYQKIVL